MRSINDTCLCIAGTSPKLRRCTALGIVCMSQGYNQHWVVSAFTTCLTHSTNDSRCCCCSESSTDPIFTATFCVRCDTTCSLVCHKTEFVHARNSCTYQFLLIAPSPSLVASGVRQTPAETMQMMPASTKTLGPVYKLLSRFDVFCLLRLDCNHSLLNLPQ